MEPVAPVTIKPIEDNKEPVINVIMKITFVVLLLILIGGLGYIITTSNKKPVTKIIPTLTPTPSIAQLQEFQGKIIELKTIKVSLAKEVNKIEFSFKLETNEKGVKKTQVIFFNKQELETLKVIDSSEKIISYKDLKVGQNIKFDQRYLVINMVK